MRDIDIDQLAFKVADACLLPGRLTFPLLWGHSRLYWGSDGTLRTLLTAYLMLCYKDLAQPTTTISQQPARQPTMSSSVSSASVMKHYSCDPLSPCQSHVDLFRQSQPDSGLVPSTHDKPQRKYPQWSQSCQQRQADNQEEDLLKEWSAWYCDMFLIWFQSQ